MNTNRRAFVAAAAVFILFVAFAPVGSRDGRTFQIDEAHKISESHFVRLFATGDFSSPEWFRNIVDRTNPPIGKYFLGLAIVAHGLSLPPPPSLSAYAHNGHIPAYFSRDINERYAQYLVPARHGMLIVSALTAALLMWSAIRFHSATAGIVSVLCFSVHDLTRGWGALAVFDPLLALAAIAILPVGCALWQNPRSVRAAVGAGVICGLAAGVRFNGAICFVFIVAALLLSPRRLESLRAIVISAAAAAVIFIGLNPYYWGADGDTHFIGTRIVLRLVAQLDDAASILAGLPHLATPLDRLRFAGLILFGSAIGMVMWLAVSLGVLLPVIRSRVTAQMRTTYLWSVVVAGGTILWLPVPFQRYLLFTLPPVALLSGIGVSELIALLRKSSAADRIQAQASSVAQTPL